jgi:hypothetical protein
MIHRGLLYEKAISVAHLHVFETKTVSDPDHLLFAGGSVHPPPLVLMMTVLTNIF